MLGTSSPIYLDEDQIDLFGPIAEKNGIESLRRGRRLIAFGWYGGKFSQWLIIA